MNQGYLADACALIVFLASPDAHRVMSRAADVMRRSETRVSPITLWEITCKVTLENLPPVWGPYPSLSLLLRAQGYIAQPLGWEELEHAHQLPPHHKDPMNRMLIATAPRHDLTILSNDAVFAAYGVPCLW